MKNILFNRKFRISATLLYSAALITLVGSCSRESDRADAYGNFEATEITISAESKGKLLFFNVSEGQKLNIGDTIGLIDTATLALTREQALIQKEIIASKASTVLSQINVLEEQKKSLLTEKSRIENLLADSAAPAKLLDEIVGRINVIESQMKTVRTQNQSVLDECKAVDVQYKIIEDQLSRCYIINPVDGTVLTKFAEPDEIVIPGKSLYRIADISELELRAFISGEYLSSVLLGQEVTVRIDAPGDSLISLKGIISWISPNAEFTPKIIQTKEERVNLVYAIKAKVKNDGRIKIGMPGEILFSNNEELSDNGE